jgi:hypothetical protein
MEFEGQFNYDLVYDYNVEERLSGSCSIDNVEGE